MYSAVIKIIPILFFFLSSSAFSQNKQHPADTLTKSKSIGKSRWHPYIGLHISGDAEMFYIGPSLQAGTDFQLKKRLVLSGYVHYFSKKIDNAKSGGFFEHGRFKTITGELLVQGNTSKNLNRSFFLAGGVALQYWHDRYSNSFDNWDNERTTLIPAIRFGYFFPLNKQKITIEINATGPYSYKDGSSSVIEILTQISLGCRFIF